MRLIFSLFALMLLATPTHSQYYSSSACQPAVRCVPRTSSQCVPWSSRVWGPQPRIIAAPATRTAAPAVRTRTVVQPATGDSSARSIVGLPPAPAVQPPKPPKPPVAVKPPVVAAPRPACACPKLLARLDAISKAIADMDCAAGLEEELQAIKAAIVALAQMPPSSGAGDLSRIEDRLANIERALQALPTEFPATDLSRVEDRLANIERDLTALGHNVDNVAAGQSQIVYGLTEVVTAQAGTNAQLAEAIKLLKEAGNPEVTLTVQSTPNLPASYVDTSTIWAVQRQTGVSHIVIVINSDDPEWPRLEPEYEKAKHKFPAIQLVDVQASGLKISPTPQLVLYYAEEGHAPEVISGARVVASKLRELYTH